MLVFSLTLILILVAVVFEIITAINILSRKWQLKETEDSKLIWGILTIILLGWIASLIFSVTNIKKYEQLVSNPIQ